MHPRAFVSRVHIPCVCVCRYRKDSKEVDALRRSREDSIQNDRRSVWRECAWRRIVVALPTSPWLSSIYCCSVISPNSYVRYTLPFLDPRMDRFWIPIPYLHLKNTSPTTLWCYRFDIWNLCWLMAQAPPGLWFTVWVMGMRIFVSATTRVDTEMHT